MSHPTHPKCPGCGKALFKAFDGPWNGKPGVKVRPADPYRFCRNTKCSHSGPSGVHPSPEPGPGVKKAKPTPKPLKVAPEPPVPIPTPRPPTRAIASRKASSPQPATKPPGEPAPVAKARERIRELIRQITEGEPKVAVGLALALVNQETGNHAAANLLIDEMGLDKLFGVQRFTPPEKS